MRVDSICSSGEIHARILSASGHYALCPIRDIVGYSAALNSQSGRPAYRPVGPARSDTPDRAVPGAGIAYNTGADENGPGRLNADPGRYPR